MCLRLLALMGGHGWSYRPPTKRYIQEPRQKWVVATRAPATASAPPAATPAHVRPAAMSAPAPALQTAATAIAKRRGAGLGGRGGACTQCRTMPLKTASNRFHPAAPTAAMNAKPQSTVGDRSAVPAMMLMALRAGVKRSQRTESATRGSESHANPCNISLERTLSVTAIGALPRGGQGAR